MAKRISILLGSCLLLQIGALVRSDSSVSFAPEKSLAQAEHLVPLYHEQHAREILGAKNFAAISWSEGEDAFAGRSIELTHYIRNKVRDLLPKPWRPKTSRIAKALIDHANRHKMDPLFLMALIQHESRFNPIVVGSHGEIGLMQIKPETARWLLGDSDLSDQKIKKMLRNPETNIAIGTSYIARLRLRYQGKSDLYISAYNMGPTNVNRRLAEGVRPKVYVKKVLKQYAALTEGFTDTDLAEELLTTARQIASNGGSTLVVR